MAGVFRESITDTDVQLSPSPRFWKHLAENSHDGILITDRSGNIVFWNKSCEEIYGYTSDEILGKHISVLGGGEDASSRFLREIKIENIISEGGARRYHTQLTRRDGKKIDVSITLDLIRDSNGAVIGAVGIHRDISDLMYTRNHLEKQRKRLTLLLNLANRIYQAENYRSLFRAVIDTLLQYAPECVIAIYRHDEGKNTVTLVAEAGFSSEVKKKVKRIRLTEGLISLFFASDEVQIIEDYSLFPESLRQIVEESNFRTLVAIPVKIGERLWGKVVLAYAMEVHFPEDLRYLLQGIGAQVGAAVERVSLVTTLKSELQKKKNLNRLLSVNYGYTRALFDNVPEAVFVADAQTYRIHDVNQVAIERYGYDREAFLSLTLHDLFSQPDRRQAVKDGLNSGKEAMHRKKNGALFPVQLYTQVLTSSAGKQLIMIAVDISARKEADAKIRLLADTLASVRDCVSVTDLDDRFIYVNPAFSKTYGYTQEEIVGQKPSILWSDKNSPQVTSEIFSGTLKGGWQGELWNRRKDGTEFPIYLTTSPITNENGDVVGLVGVARDISEQKSIEKALRESEAQFRNLTELANAAIFVARKNELLYVNPRGAEISGYPEEELKKMKLMNLVFPEDWPRLKAFLSELERDTMGRRTIEFRIVTAQGTTRWLRFAASLIDSFGAPAVIGHALDVTQLRETQKKLQASESKFAFLFQHLQDGVFILQGDCLVLVNKRFEEMFGYSSDESCSREFTFGRLFPVESRAIMQNRLRNAILRPDLKEQYECVAQSRDGKRIDIELSVSYIEWEGQPSLLGIVRDITDKRILENQLRQAQKLEAIGQLAGGVAHDFNNMLTGILGYAQMGDTLAGENSPLKPYFGTIQKAAERASQITRKLLAFSRKQILEPRYFDLNAYISEMGSFLRKVLGEHIELHYEFNEKLPPLFADPSAIDQIITNLCVNARDAMPDGGCIIIETDRELFRETKSVINLELTPGEYIKLSVTDNGVGMEEHVLGHIFEPFYTTKEPGKGTGLGLSVVYGLMKQHNGAISVYSEPGKGTTFTAYFPVVRPEERTAGTSEGTHPDFKGSETILLVEDDELVRGLIEEVLTSANYRVLTAADGEEAWRLYQRHAEDIQMVIADVVMPKEGGISLHKRLAALNSRLPILFISGYSRGGIHNNFILKKGVQFLQKPFDGKKLLEKVRCILDKK